MVVRGMIIKPISQCSKVLDFSPRRVWPAALPVLSWKGHMVCGFDRAAASAPAASQAEAVDVSDRLFLDVWQACHPELALAELARLTAALQNMNREFFVEIGEGLFALYGLRLNDRLMQVLEVLVGCPREFQTWCDDKKMSARDLAPLLAVADVREISPLLLELPKMMISKFEGARALELFVELYLMGRPLNDLLPTSDNGGLYVRRLERWRRPGASERDEEWRKTVGEWPWPAQVQAEWQRFGDQAGLEIKIRTTSPDDFAKKLERLSEIPDTWSTKN